MAGSDEARILFNVATCSDAPLTSQQEQVLGLAAGTISDITSTIISECHERCDRGDACSLEVTDRVLETGGITFDANCERCPNPELAQIAIRSIAAYADACLAKINEVAPMLIGDGDGETTNPADGDLLYCARRVSNITLEDMSKRLGISTGYLSMIESGLRPKLPSDVVAGYERELGYEPGTLQSRVVLADRRRTTRLRRIKGDK